MEIKIINPQEVESFREIRLEALKSHPEAFGSSYEEECLFSLESFKNRLEGSNTYVFGAFVENDLLGIVGLMPEHKNKLKHRASINSMYVSHKARKSGIGRKLMMAAIDKAKELKNIEQIHLAVVSTNKTAIKLYLSLGFELYGKDKKVLKINDKYYDEDLMVLFI